MTCQLSRFPNVIKFFILLSVPIPLSSGKQKYSIKEQRTLSPFSPPSPFRSSNKRPMGYLPSRPLMTTRYQNHASAQPALTAIHTAMSTVDILHSPHAYPVRILKTAIARQVVDVLCEVSIVDAVMVGRFGAPLVPSKCDNHGTSTSD